jgi:hypothetical protein
MVKNNNIISGKAMAVIVGTICTVGPWFSEIEFIAKLLVSLVGVALLYFGTRKD